jgi:DNA-binding cell septation regulator SpoVG
MPSYKIKQVDEQDKAVYQDVCYPVTKEFREKLYADIVNQYEISKAKKEEQVLGYAQTQAQSQDKTGFKEIKQETLFR